jgi:hypothetical protein
MQAVLDEVIEKVAQFSDEDRDKLFQFLLETKQKPKANGGKGYVSPNTIWVRENSHKYRGLHIALKDGELIATGKTIKEADLKAKEKGVKNPLLHYIPAEDEEVWGGW